MELRDAVATLSDLGDRFKGFEQRISHDRDKMLSEMRHDRERLESKIDSAIREAQLRTDGALGKLATELNGLKNLGYAAVAAAVLIFGWQAYEIRSVQTAFIERTDKIYELMLGKAATANAPVGAPREAAPE